MPLTIGGWPLEHVDASSFRNRGCHRIARSGAAPYAEAQGARPGHARLPGVWRIRDVVSVRVDEIWARRGGLALHRSHAHNESQDDERRGESQTSHERDDLSQTHLVSGRFFGRKEAGHNSSGRWRWWRRLRAPGDHWGLPARGATGPEKKLPKGKASGKSGKVRLLRAARTRTDKPLNSDACGVS